MGLSMANAESNFKISFKLHDPSVKIEYFDPAKITYISDWDISLNIYSRLVNFNNDGEIVSGLASKFYWKDNDAHFEIRDDFKTVDGYKITPEDVALSLKRLLIINSNTHGKLRDILCETNEIKNINSKFECIKFNEKEVILKTKKKDTFLFNTLTAVDFSIIPKNSFNHQSLAITDYKNTSGLYYFYGYSKDKNITLHINPKHWKYSNQIPQIIEIIPESKLIDSLNSLNESILSEKIDATSRMNRLKPDDFIKIKSLLEPKKVKFNIHQTEPIMLSFLKMNNSIWLKDQNIKFSILQDIQSLINKKRNELENNNRKITSYIFNPNTHGGLTNDQISLYQKSLNQKIDPSIPKLKISIGILDRLIPLYFGIFRDGYFQYEIISIPFDQNYIEFAQNKSNNIDLFLLEQDIMFEEDINLLSFSFSTTSIFSLKDKNAEIWLDKFRSEEDIKARIKMLQKLHYDSLVKNTSVIPLFTKSIGAIALNGWKLDFSPYTADTPFWEIIRED